MKRRYLITSVIALALAGVLGIGATLAYFSDNDAAKNTFTVGKVAIDLDEPSWVPEDAQDLEPGDSVAKDPAITNTGKNPAYMIMKVEGMDQMRANAFEVYFDDDNWVPVDADGSALTPAIVDAAASLTGNAEAQLADGYYVYVGANQGVVAVGEVTEPLFETVYYTTAGTGAEFGDYLVRGILNAQKSGVSHYEIWEKTDLGANANAFDSRDAAEAYEAANLLAGGAADIYEVEPDDVSGKFVIWERTAWDAALNQANSFDTYDKAADFIVSKDGLNASAATYTFDMDLSAYAIQSENVTFGNSVDGYDWVRILLGSDATVSGNN